MKKSLPIAEILVIELFVRSYTVSLGNFGLTFFFGTAPHAPMNFFAPIFFPIIFPTLQATFTAFLCIFADFQFCSTWVFFKKASELWQFYPISSLCQWVLRISRSTASVSPMEPTHHSASISLQSFVGIFQFPSFILLQ
jgi:hypothetical protein